jgi:class 3 adenylate cyclase
MTDERRIVTILFADVADSTALGEALDPEDLRALLARYYAIAREVIEAHGGTLEKFIGDAVMAIFGLPRAHGDDAERALAAADALRSRLAAEPALAPFELRFGVSTGEVVASRDTSGGDFLVTGDAVNLAARLQQSAQLGEILCSERTARAAARRFAFGPVRELVVRGKKLQVNGYPLDRALEVPRVERMPMIGRDSDLEQLELAARRAFAEGRPQLVSVIAPAGTGKTRLVEEFIARLESGVGAAGRAATPPLVAIAQCLPYGQRLTFWPLRAVLHRFVGFDDEPTPEELRRRTAAWLASRGIGDADEVAGLLASTLGAAEIAQPDRIAMFNAWRSAVQAAGSAGPVVIVFEDLHWSSDTLLDLVEHVMQPWASLPILMIALTRPELLDRRPTWGGGKRNHTSISLEPLPDDATADLVRRMLASHVEEVVRRVVARAEGNPFYAGELVRAVIERAADAGDPLAVDRALGSLPDTVHAAVLARLDLLPADERHALQLGAVIGRSFSAEAVAALGGLDSERAQAACRALVERDLLRPAADGYVFRHILIREVAYQALARSERARLHASAAEWLEARAVGREDAMAELVAFHWREAAQLAGASATAEQKRRAVDWLARAAESAFAGAATIEGIGHLRAAIELAETERQVDLLERLGSSMQSGSAAALPLQRAFELAQAQGRSAEDRLRIFARLLMFDMRTTGSVATRCSNEQMAERRAAGRALLAQVDPEGLAAARFLAADAFYPFWSQQGVSNAELDASMRDAQRAATLAQRHDDVDLYSAALDGQISIFNERSDFPGALGVARERIKLGRRMAASERIDAYSMVVWQAGLVGLLAEAEAASAEGLGQFQPGQEPGWMLGLVAWRLYTLTVIGRWSDVVALGMRALQLWEEMGRGSAGFALRGLIVASHVARSRGDPIGEKLDEAAEAILDQFAASDAAELPGGMRLRHLALLRLDRGGLEQVLDNWNAKRPSPEGCERQLNAMSDHGWNVDARITEAMLAWALRTGTRLLEVQVRRAIGLRDGDVGQLETAAQIADACGAGALLGRVRYEAARARRDDAGMDAAIRALEAMGDRAQIARYRG